MPSNHPRSLQANHPSGKACRGLGIRVLANKAQSKTRRRKNRLRAELSVGGSVHDPQQPSSVLSSSSSRMAKWRGVRERFRGDVGQRASTAARSRHERVGVPGEASFMGGPCESPRQLGQPPRTATLAVMPPRWTRLHQGMPAMPFVPSQCST